MSDHLHAMWTLPEGDANYPIRWSLIKAGFSRCIPKDERRNPSRISKGERGIWQRRYWEHMIRDEDDYNKHMNYIHFNPVKHGLVKGVKDWPHSTFIGVLNKAFIHWSGVGMVWMIQTMRITVNERAAIHFG